MTTEKLSDVVEVKEKIRQGKVAIFLFEFFGRLNNRKGSLRSTASSKTYFLQKNYKKNFKKGSRLNCPLRISQPIHTLPKNLRASLILGVIVNSFDKTGLYCVFSLVVHGFGINLVI